MPLIFSGHLSGSMTELLLHITLLDIGGGGQSGPQRMACKQFSRAASGSSGQRPAANTVCLTQRTTCVSERRSTSTVLLSLRMGRDSGTRASQANRIQLSIAITGRSDHWHGGIGPHKTFSCYICGPLATLLSMRNGEGRGVGLRCAPHRQFPSRYMNCAFVGRLSGQRGRHLRADDRVADALSQCLVDPRKKGCHPRVRPMETTSIAYSVPSRRSRIIKCHKQTSFLLLVRGID
jgi:hypothetical protein